MPDATALRNSGAPGAARLLSPYTGALAWQFAVWRKGGDMNDPTRQLIERYWPTMNGNDFGAVGELLHDDFVLDYPQSGERVRGREHNTLINERYPSPGPWSLSVERLLVSDAEAVSDVRVRGAEFDGRVISFFEIRAGRIWCMTEYWPEPFAAPIWRTAWVERIP